MNMTIKNIIGNIWEKKEKMKDLLKLKQKDMDKKLNADFYKPENQALIRMEWKTMRQCDFCKKWKVTRQTAVAYLGLKDYFTFRDPNKYAERLKYESNYIRNHIEKVEENYQKILDKFQTTREEINRKLFDYTFTEILNGTCINWKLKPKESLKYFTK